MWKQTIAITTALLIVLTSVIAYQYSAIKGNRQVWADDLQAHNSIVSINVKICNLNANSKDFKPTLFLDLPIRKVFYWGTVKESSWNNVNVWKNFTNYRLVEGVNTSYQNRVLTTESIRIFHDIPGWVGVGKTKAQSKKKEVIFDKITFTGRECKELKLEYDNVLNPTYALPLKYDIGENREEILDPLVNSTDYQFNGVTDSNSTVTTATIMSATNISQNVNGTYGNTTDLFSQWLLDEGTGAINHADTVGRSNLIAINSVNWSTGISSPNGNSVTPNGSGFGGRTNPPFNGYMCANNTLIPINGSSIDFYTTVYSYHGINDTNVECTIGQCFTTLMSAGNMRIRINASLHLWAIGTPTGNSNDSALGRSLVWSGKTLTNASRDHVALVYNGSKLRIYINGSDVSVYNNTDPFALINTSNMGVKFGSASGDGSNTCDGDGSRIKSCEEGYWSSCMNATFDQIRWRNNTVTSFSTSSGTKWVSNTITTANMTRFRPAFSSNAPSNVNLSISFDGTTNRLENLISGNNYNWSTNPRNSLVIWTELNGTVDFYGVNITLASPIIADMNSQNVSHNNSLSITVSCTDGLPNPTMYYYDNTSLFNIDYNAGTISYDPSQAQTGNYQVEITCEENNLNITKPLNLTIFNSAINTTRVTLNPEQPNPSDTVICTSTGTDNEDDGATTGTTYRFYVNDVTIQTGNVNSLTTTLNQGDTIICEVLAYDGQLNSTSWLNSTLTVVTGSGGGGGGRDANDEEDDDDNVILPQSPTPPPPEPPLKPTLEEIFKEIPPPEVCGDNICSQSETGKLPLIGDLFATDSTCYKDCPFDLDVIFFEFGRFTKCLTTRNCQSNTNFIVTIFTSIILSGVLWFLLLGDKDDKKKKRKK